MRVFSNYVGNSIASIVSGWMIGLGNFRLLFLTCAGVALSQLIVYQLLCRPFLTEPPAGGASSAREQYKKA